MPSRIETQSTSNPSFPDWVITLSQVILYLCTVIPLRVRYRAQKTLPGNLNVLRQGSLLVANHQSMVDPFFITMSLPFRTYLSILPIRFPTAHHIFTHPLYNPWFFPILSFFGCFTIGMTSQERMRSIFYIRELLVRGKTVFVFPEGGITEDETVRELKRGIDFFIQNARNVIFVKLHGFNEARASGERRRIVFGSVMEPPPRMSVETMREYLQTL